MDFPDEKKKKDGTKKSETNSTSSAGARLNVIVTNDAVGIGDYTGIRAT